MRLPYEILKKNPKNNAWEFVNGTQASSMKGAIRFAQDWIQTHGSGPGVYAIAFAGKIQKKFIADEPRNLDEVTAFLFNDNKKRYIIREENFPIQYPEPLFT